MKIFKTSSKNAVSRNYEQKLRSEGGLNSSKFAKMYARDARVLYATEVVLYATKLQKSAKF